MKTMLSKQFLLAVCLLALLTLTCLPVHASDFATEAPPPGWQYDPALFESTPTPQPKYPDVYWGQESDLVLKLQEKLAELGYFSGLPEYAPGCFDEVTLEAVNRFREQMLLPTVLVLRSEDLDFIFTSETKYIEKEELLTPTPPAGWVATSTPAP